MLYLALAGCQNTPAHAPIDWWHDAQGGIIAKDRPPPPGADQPYPTMGPIPDKPVLPDKTARAALLDQLAMERDRAQRLAAYTPITLIPPPPPPAAPKPAAPDDQTANASLPAAEAPPPPASPAPAKQRAFDAQVAGPAGPVIIAGNGADETGLPPIPDAPPAPATFEGVLAEPAPTPPPPVPDRLPQASRGAAILFPTGQAILAPSQMPTLKDVANHRKNHLVEIDGYGEASADTPEAQEAAIALGLKRAQIVAEALTSQQHVPETAIRLNANAFGRGADIRIIP
jgi:outer membrane protein OmpA-like peptidoglycan-associated protein